jgi:hypothetical protein
MLALGVRCEKCSKSFDDKSYFKLFDQHGVAHSMYWFNPQLSNIHPVVVNFCGPECSTKWFEGKR